MYTFDSRVRYSEISKEGTLALSSIINYMQDCSTFQSEDLGIGVEYLKEQKKVWLLNSWQLQIEKLPLLGERITVGTWAYGFEGMYGYRNFVINNKNEEHLVKANSIWVFYDLEKGRPSKITEETLKAYGNEPKLDMEYAGRKVPMPEGGIQKDPFPVRQYQIDTNGHVNNGQYIRMAQECIPTLSAVTGLRAEYKKSAVFGDCIYPVVGKTEEGYTVSLNDKKGKAYAVIAFAT